MGTKIGFAPGRILSQSFKTARWIVLGVLSGFILFLVFVFTGRAGRGHAGRLGRCHEIAPSII